MARVLLTADTERYFRNTAEEIEDNFYVNSLQPAYRILKKLRSKSAPQVSFIRMADGRLVSDTEEYRERWTGYFDQVYSYRVDPTSVQVATADPLFNETPFSLAEVKKVVKGLKDGRAAGIYGISGEILKTVDGPIIRGLHAVITTVWQAAIIPPDWKKKRLVVPIWKVKGDRHDCNNYRGLVMLNVHGVRSLAASTNTRPPTKVPDT